MATKFMTCTVLVLQSTMTCHVFSGGSADVNVVDINGSMCRWWGSRSAGSLLPPIHRWDGRPWPHVYCCSCDVSAAHTAP